MREFHTKVIRWWLWLGAAMIFIMVMIGGITRLTGSGLSMTDWNLIMGAVPPLNDAQWQQTFERYQQFPEYQQVNTGMTLQQFKGIFFWEYLHRMMGRLIGIVFLLPFLFFWIKGWFSRRMFKRAVILFCLGALQGAMGWIMVKSGLVDMPRVSHYRLAMHLLLAFAVAGCCVWFALDIGREDATKHKPSSAYSALRKWSLVVVAFFFIQITYGAFTAGLDAGLIYNTFPLMNGAWVPQNMWSLHPAIINLFANMGVVQWIHRIIGTVVGLLVIGLWIKSRTLNISAAVALRATVLFGIILLQYTLGVLTLLNHVPVALGVAHQAGAVLFWIAWLAFHHRLNTEIYGGGTTSEQPIGLNGNQEPQTVKNVYYENR